MATHSSILAWKMSWTEKPGRHMVYGISSLTWPSKWTTTKTTEKHLEKKSLERAVSLRGEVNNIWCSIEVMEDVNKFMRKEMQTQDTVCCRLQDRPEFELWLPLTLLHYVWKFASVQFSSVAQSCLTLCDPMNHSTPGLPVHHKLLEITQIHAHQVGDAIQPSHPLSSPSPPAPSPSQHQGLFQWVNSSHEVAKVLEFQLQHQSFQWTPRTDLL